jgi:hypothetical protein
MLQIKSKTFLNENIKIMMLEMNILCKKDKVKSANYKVIFI